MGVRGLSGDAGKKRSYGCRGIWWGMPEVQLKHEQLDDLAGTNGGLLLTSSSRLLSFNLNGLKLIRGESVELWGDLLLELSGLKTSSSSEMALGW